MSTNGKSTALTVVDEKELQALTTSAKALWQKDLTPDQARTLAQVALSYGLDPLAGELIPYEGKPYITVDGRLRKARESGKFQGIIEDRAATPEEYKALKVGPNDMLWFISIKHADWIKCNGAYGRVRSDDRSPVARSHMWELARKRALYRALREAFGMPLPGIYEDENIATAPPDAGDGDTIVNVMATEGQVAAIHILSKELHLTEEQYRSELVRRYGKTSSTDLTQFQAQDLLDDWTEKATFNEGHGAESTQSLEALFEEVVETKPEKPEKPQPEAPMGNVAWEQWYALANRVQLDCKAAWEVFVLDWGEKGQKFERNKPLNANPARAAELYQDLQRRYDAAMGQQTTGPEPEPAQEGMGI